MKKKYLLTFVFVFSLCLQAQQSTNRVQPNSYPMPKVEIETIYLTTADFLTKVANYEKTPDKWLYLGDKPCLIDFYTTWCGPCKMVAPILEDLAKEYKGKIYIYKVDIEKERALAQAFAISSIPTFLFCPLSENPQMARGVMAKENFKRAIEEVLLKTTTKN